MSTFAITCEVPPSVFARAITDAVLVQYSKRSLALPVLAFRRSRSFECRFAKLYIAGCSPYGGQLRGAQQARSRPWPDLLASRARHLAVFRARSRFALLIFRPVERSESLLRFQSLRCRGSSRLSTHRPIRDDSRSSRPFWDIEPGPLVLALRRSRPIQARHLDARTYLARARLAAIALVSARSPPGCSGCSACVHLSATACVPAHSPCGARDRARTLHLTVRGPFNVHVRLGAHVRVLTRSPCGDRAHPRSRSPEQRHAYVAR